MKKQPQSTGFQGKLVPALINGLTVLISLAAVDKTKRTVHHGEFEGEKVNSPATLQIGDSVAIWPEADNKNVAITIPKPAMGLMCQQYLESAGYTVTKKS